METQTGGEDRPLTREHKLRVREQMLKDIELLLAPYRNKDIGVRLLSDKTEISEKTLKRIMRGESDPNNITVQRFYTHFFKVAQDSALLSDVHHSVKEELERQLQEDRRKSGKDMERLLAGNQVFRDIFIFSRTGGTTKAWVLERYGSYGMEVVALMLKEDLLVEREKGVYFEGPLSVSKGPSTLKVVIQDLVGGLREEYLQELGHNLAYYMVEGVTDEVYQAALELTEEHKKSMAQLIFRTEARGHRRFYTACVVDELQELEKKGRLH